MTAAELDSTIRDAATLHREGKLVDAKGYYQRALQSAPGDARALYGLGLIEFHMGKLDTAQLLISRASMAKGGVAAHHFSLGEISRLCGDLAGAVAEYRRALAINPTYASALRCLGIVLAGDGRFREAIQCFERLLSFEPSQVALLRLSSWYLRCGLIAEAEQCCLEAVRRYPEESTVHFALGNVYLHQGDSDRAAMCHRLASELADSKGDKRIASYARINLAKAFLGQWNVDDAINLFQESLQISPTSWAHSGFLLSMHYQSHRCPSKMFQEHIRWAQQQTNTIQARVWPRRFSCSTRPLRVGFVSPDFREHPVSVFLEPVLLHFDRTRFRIFCYSDVVTEDRITARIRSLADRWHRIAGASDLDVAKVIADDGIDILVDLAGHTAANRLLMFAAKAAPIQVSHFGYPNTSGLATMDYRITDSLMDPPGDAEAYYTERLCRLPDVAWCYRPAVNSSALSKLPLLKTKHITFGCFNRIEKITRDMIRIWAQVLRAVPGSLLWIFCCSSEIAHQRLRHAMEQEGVAPDRLRICHRQSQADYFAAHASIDIALDTFPYNGAVTTCDQLWMGVPVITLAGKQYASRQGLALLSHVQLQSLVAKTPEQYVAAAIGLARDVDRLVEMRNGLRDLMESSPIMNYPLYVQHLEDAYNTMCRDRLCAKAWNERS